VHESATAGYDDSVLWERIREGRGGRSVMADRRDDETWRREVIVLKIQKP